MPRYIIERLWNDLDDEQMHAVGTRSRRIANERFPHITWEHSHVVIDEEGGLRSYCVYQAPDAAVLRDHARELGEHQLARILEIERDVGPADYAD